MQINLHQLRAFFLVVREKSVTRAADKLFVTQPAVTMQVKALEESLGVKLFNKIGKRIELTEAGNNLFNYAQRIFEIVEELEYVIEGYRELKTGSLTIGTTRSFARHLMPGVLSKFQENFPGIKVYLKEGSSQDIADGLLDFKYDLGIIGPFQYKGKLKVVPYTKEEFCLVVSPRHRFAEKDAVSIQDLKNEPIIIREEGSGSRHAILSMLNSYNIKPSVLVEAGSVEFIKEYVMKDRGISFLYKPEVELETRMGLLKPLNIHEGPVFVQTFLVFPREMELSPPAKAFLKLVNK
jgi:DNA-binding transcriptional LysR family regulator